MREKYRRLRKKKTEIEEKQKKFETERRKVNGKGALGRRIEKAV